MNSAEHLKAITINREVNRSAVRTAETLAALEDPALLETLAEVDRLTKPLVGDRLIPTERLRLAELLRRLRAPGRPQSAGSGVVVGHATPPHPSPSPPSGFVNPFAPNMPGKG